MKVTYTELKKHLTEPTRYLLRSTITAYPAEIRIAIDRFSGVIAGRNAEESFKLSRPNDELWCAELILAPAWRTETNLSGLVSMTPPQAALIPSNIPTKQPTP